MPCLGSVSLQRCIGSECAAAATIVASGAGAHLCCLAQRARCPALPCPALLVCLQVRLNKVNEMCFADIVCKLELMEPCSSGGEGCAASAALPCTRTACCADALPGRPPALPIDLPARCRSCWLQSRTASR